MKPRLDELESIVRKRICATCAEEGEVSKQAPGCSSDCSLFELFPLVAQAVNATESDKIEDYIKAIRENVCPNCLDHALDGSCERRGRDCALDRYMDRVVEAIKEATGKSFEPRPLAAH
jgi:hypothetical protein